MATIDLNRIAVFVRVVEEESFTAAAAALGIPTSSASRAVARLEEAPASCTSPTAASTSSSGCRR
jgi:hypothetical protein